MTNEKSGGQETKLYRHTSVALRASCQEAKLIKKSSQLSCNLFFFNPQNGQKSDAHMWHISLILIICVVMRHVDRDRSNSAICPSPFSDCGYYIPTFTHANILPHYRSDNVHRYLNNCALRTLYKKQVIIYIYLPTSKCLAFSYFQEFLLFTLTVCLWGFCLLCRHTKMTLEIREEKSCSLPKTKCFEDTRRIDKETYSSSNIMSTDSHIKPT